MDMFFNLSGPNKLNALDNLFDLLDESDSDEELDESNDKQKRVRPTSFEKPFNIRQIFDFNEDESEVTCTLCSKAFKIQKNSTGNLWRHVRSVHKEYESSAPQEEKLSYNHTAYADNLFKCTISTDSPYESFACDSFYDLQRYLNKDVKVLTLPDYHSMQDERLSYYRKKLKEHFRTVNSKINLSVIGWFGPLSKYICVSCSYLDGGEIRSFPLEVVKQVLNDNVLFQEVMDVLNKFEIAPKIHNIITENYSGGETSFVDLFEKWAIENNYSFRKSSNSVVIERESLTKLLLEVTERLKEKYPSLESLLFFIKNSKTNSKNFATFCEKCSVKVGAKFFDYKYDAEYKRMFELIKKILKVKKPLEMLFAGFTKPQIFEEKYRKFEYKFYSEEEWTFLEEFEGMMKPIIKCIEDTKQDVYFSVGYVIKLSEIVRDKHQNPKITSNPSSAKVLSMLRCFDEPTKYFTYDSLLETALVVFDPRLKKSMFESGKYPISEALLERLKDDYVEKSLMDANKGPSTFPVKKESLIENWNQYFDSPVMVNKKKFDLFSFWTSCSFIPLKTYVLDIISIGRCVSLTDELYEVCRSLDSQGTTKTKQEEKAKRMCLKNWLFSPLLNESGDL